MVMWVAVMLVVTALWLNVKVREAFEASGLSVATKAPCDVYFTDDPTACEQGKFRVHRSVFEIEKMLLQKSIAARGGTPTFEQNDRMRELDAILATYERFPDGMSCKITVPGWSRLPTNEQERAMAYGDIAQNRDRGKPEQWAFCYAPNTWGKPPANPPLRVAKENDGTPIRFQVAGSTDWWTRGSFTSFTTDAVKASVCKEAPPDKEVPASLGFAFPSLPDLAPVLQAVRVQGKKLSLQELDAATLPADTQETLLSMFARWGNEVVTRSRGTEVLEWRPAPLSVMVVQLRETLCGKMDVVYTVQTVTLQLRDTIRLKSVSPFQLHLKGNIDDVRKVRDKLYKVSKQMEKQMGNLDRAISVIERLARKIKFLRKLLDAMFRLVRAILNQLMLVVRMYNEASATYDAMRATMLRGILAQLRASAFVFTKSMDTANMSYDRLVYVPI